METNRVLNSYTTVKGIGGVEDQDFGMGSISPRKSTERSPYRPI